MAGGEGKGFRFPRTRIRASAGGSNHNRTVCTLPLTMMRPDDQDIQQRPVQLSRRHRCRRCRRSCSLDWYDHSAPGLIRLYGNDRLTIGGEVHVMGAYDARDEDRPRFPYPPDEENDKPLGDAMSCRALERCTQGLDLVPELYGRCSRRGKVHAAEDCIFIVQTFQIKPGYPGRSDRLPAPCRASRSVDTMSSISSSSRCCRFVLSRSSPTTTWRRSRRICSSSSRRSGLRSILPAMY